MSRFSPKSGLAVYTADGQPIGLEQEIAKGGEGSVWSIAGKPDVVAKFYHQGLGADHAKKLEAMCRLKSESLTRIAAWPVELLTPSASGSPQGFVMRRINGYEQAHLLYTPKSRRTHFPEAQLPFILHASTNIPRAFATVHDMGQVIGDVNHGNLLISKDARVALIDCDSFEITDGQNWFQCPVGVPTYTPPELQGKSFRGIRRTQQHDAFGLAVLIFHMLFLGRHPFSGIFRHGNDNMTIEDAIREFRFAYSPDKQSTEMEQPAWVPPLTVYPAEIGTLFMRAFGRDGALGKRPSAHEWIPALEGLSRNLTRCSTNESHYYTIGLSSCPWCKAEGASGIPMFGFTVTIIRSQEFDLIAIWGQIESIQPDESATPKDANAYVDQCKPDPRIDDLRGKRRKKRLLSVGSILVAIMVVAPGIIPAFLSVGILATALAVMVALWKQGNSGIDEFDRAKRDALQNFEVATARWNKVQKAPESFIEAKKRLESQKQELQELPTVRARRLAQLQADLHRKQLQVWLEQHKIEDAAIPNIGPGRKNTLRAYGIEDASDIGPSMQIKGFGSSLKTALWLWRKSVEQQFVFNPNKGIDPADIRALDLEIAQKKNSLVQSLSSGPLLLKQTLLSWKIDRDSALSNLDQWSRAAAQAEVNLKHLGRW